MERKIKVVIDRSKWRTGGYGPYQTGDSGTSLLNEQGYMCCLGFCMNASKVAKKDLLDRIGPMSTLNSLRQDSDKITSILRSNGVRALVSPTSGGESKHFSSTPLTNKAMAINDAESTTTAEKEGKLLELFKDSVFDIEFTGSYHFPE